MANSRSSSRCSSVASYGQRPPSLSDPPPPPTVMGLDPNDGRGDEIQPCPIGFHPMAHTPPPPIYATQEQLREEHRQQQMLPPKPAKERRLPSRSGSTASLFSPFASLTRRLGAKHKSSKTSASSSRSTGHGSRMSTPVEFPAGSQQYQGAVISRSVTPASVYSTFPRIHSSSSSNTPSPSGRTPFISQLLGLNGANGGVRGACVGGGGGSSSSSSATVPATTSCPSCPSPGPSYSSSSRLSSSGGYPPMMMTEVLDEPVEEEVKKKFYFFFQPKCRDSLEEVSGIKTFPSSLLAVYWNQSVFLSFLFFLGGVTCLCVSAHLHNERNNHQVPPFRFCFPYLPIIISSMKERQTKMTLVHFCFCLSDTLARLAQVEWDIIHCA